jgi:acetyl esterase/lipase
MSVSESPSVSVRVPYGPNPSQYMVLSLPAPAPVPAAGLSVAVIVHGGFWKEKYRVDNSAIESLAPYFTARGVAACMVEYRRCSPAASGEDEDEGGWPRSNDDLVAALNALHGLCGTSPHRLRPDGIFLVGHSAGGYLAMWTSMAANAARLTFVPSFCLALAPVCDLFEAAKRRLSDEGDAVEKFMQLKLPEDGDGDGDRDGDGDEGGRWRALAAYAAACPRRQLPLAVPTLLVAGLGDTDVPADYVEAFYQHVTGAGLGVVEVS